ncbi:MAG: hypothetical protein LC672_02095, partial [Acidobacteria bacterium]|nr:hypothetical protein [Acidobacteriota bacterium]
AQIESSGGGLPAYFTFVFVGLVLLGALLWLVAAVLGFSRARAFGASARWFAFAAVCLLIYHLQWIVAAFALSQNDWRLALGVVAFLNLFIALGAICAVIGFLRLTNPRP